MATPVQLVFCFDRKTLSVERVRELLRYDPETGHFHRLHDMRKNRAGSISGSMNFLRNYWRVMVDGKEYKAHRLAWFYMTGKWPKADIDHIDGDRTNNRWVNLREASRSENLCNRRPHRRNPHGLKGIGWDAQRKKWCARICKNYKKIHLGRFDTQEEAYEAYCKAATELHGEFARFERLEEE